jgi:hypothetical protein
LASRAEIALEFDAAAVELLEAADVENEETDQRALTGNEERHRN